MPGPPRKPDDRRQRRNRPPHVEVSVGGRDIVPLHVQPPPTGISKRLIAEWNSFWRSEYAVTIKWRRDGRAISRLFELYDLHDRFLRATRKRPVVVGSTGQPTLNPLTKQLAAVDAEIRQLEDRFGLTPRAAMQLGIVFTDLQKTLDDLNREANDDGDQDQEDEADPRLLKARS